MAGRNQIAYRRFADIHLRDTRLPHHRAPWDPFQPSSLGSFERGAGVRFRPEKLRDRGWVSEDGARS
jgi:hypothetical protein